jgi:hypothetical protein
MERNKKYKNMTVQFCQSILLIVDGKYVNKKLYAEVILKKTLYWNW